MNVITISDTTLAKNYCLRVIEKLMMLDYRAHSTTLPETAEGEVRKETGNRRSVFNAMLESEIQSKDDSNYIHPMDVFNIIYNCCDIMFLPVLIEKLFMCQLSIPFFIPDGFANVSTAQIWSLQGIVLEFKTENENVINMSLADIPHQFMCFVRIGKLHFSKSKILNCLLRATHHDTFFHRDCKNGGMKRILSNGTIEAAWFQPSGYTSSEYNDIFCILNLRGESTEYLKEAEFMCSIASLNFVFIGVNTLKHDTLKTYISKCGRIYTKFVLCFVAGSLREVNMPLIQKCGSYFDGDKIYAVITNWNDGRILNADEWRTKMKKVITKRLSDKGPTFKFDENFADYIRHTRSFLFDKDDVLCGKAFNRTQSLQNSLNKLNPFHRKLKMLPLQGTLWKKWCELQKEEHRNSVTSENMAEFTALKNYEKQEIRKHQFELLQDENSSGFIVEFCSFLNSCKDMKEVSLVFAWMKLQLNSCSNQIMPKLRREYVAALNDLRQHSTNKDAYHDTCISKIHESGENLNNASLGIEHIFRELGQAFEAVVEFKNINNQIPLNFEVQTRNFLSMPKLMAKCVLNGMPFELLDGETTAPPMKWISAVFDEIKNIIGMDKRVFVVSVLGVQSSGKSTLLNTMFGLQFSVSAGRCTRGAYLQLIPINRGDARLEYDYLLVIDTEGLRSQELMHNTSVHDNELATFAIGLGNVTIVNIKGENFIEMQNVLEIVVHALLRMKHARKELDALNPCCIFIHHNVATNAEDKMKIGEINLLTLLDRATEAAAEEERKKNLKTFKDIINYDDRKLFVYLPDLWQGDPPMAPVNCGYSEQVLIVKEFILKTMSKTSNPITFTQFTINMKKLWKSILYENFIFSFRNCEEVRGYIHLDEYCAELIWHFKNSNVAIQENFSSEILSCEKDVRGLIERLIPNIEDYLLSKHSNLVTDLKKYFGRSVNKDVIEQWRNRYTIHLQNTCEDEKKRIISEMHKTGDLRMQQLENIKQIDELVEKLSSFVKEKAYNLKLNNRENLSVDELEDHFNGNWESLISNVIPESANSDAATAVLQAMNADLCVMFRQHMAILQTELTNRDSFKLENFRFENYQDFFYASNRNPSWFDKLIKKRESNTDRRCMAIVQQDREKLCQLINRYVESLPSGVDFQPGYASNVLRIIKEFFDEMKQKLDEFNLSLSHELQIRYTLFFANCAANKFIDIRKMFIEKTDRLTYLRNRKPILSEMFSKAYREITVYKDTNRTSATVFAKILTGWIEHTVKRNMGQLIANEIDSKTNGVFSGKNSFFNRILLDLCETKEFLQYMEFLHNREEFLKKKIHEYVRSVLQMKKNKKTNLRLLIEEEVSRHANAVSACIEFLDKDLFTNLEDYLNVLRSRLQHTMVCTINDITTIRCLHIKDAKLFSKKTKELVNRTALEMIDSLEVTCQHSYSFPGFDNPIDLLSEKVLGCTSQCPFCSAQCCMSTKNHTHDHVALQHYPVGLELTHSSEKKLHTFCCQVAVASRSSYVQNFDSAKIVLYRDYKKYYSKWEIFPDRRADIPSYWKWFLTYFDKDLINHYDMTEIPILNEWKNITWQHAKKSLESEQPTRTQEHV